MKYEHRSAAYTPSIFSLYPVIVFTPNMSDDNSESQSGESEQQLSPIVPPIPEAFSITPEDADILMEHVKAFQEGNTELRNTLVQQMITELYKLRLSDFAFNKKEAGQVFAAMIQIQYNEPTN
jgi:hypothetical protein